MGCVSDMLFAQASFLLCIVYCCIHTRHIDKANMMIIISGRSNECIVWKQNSIEDLCKRRKQPPKYETLCLL